MPVGVYNHKNNPSLFKKGHKSALTGLSEEKQPGWKGDKVGYVALHQWVQKWKGKANHCEVCGLDNPLKKYHCSNVDHKYRRVLDDYISMCCSCHAKYDYNLSKNKKSQTEV